MASLNPALRDFWQTKADLKILKGGRMSSKTYDTAGMAIYLAANYTLKFLCMRQFQNKIQESVYAILVIQIYAFGLQDDFDIQKTVIRHLKTGSSFHFYGIQRNIQEIKGFIGADIGWIEEGEGLTKEQWEIIYPTLREEGCEGWIVYNPHLVSDYVETEFKHDPENGVIVRHINYDENPFLSQTALRKIARMKEADLEQFEHIYLGIPLLDDDDVVIKRSWIEAAIDAHIKLDIEPAGEKRMGFDIADSGKDLCAEIYVHGIVALSGDEWKGKEDELLKSCTRVYNKAVSLGASIDYDSIGVGASAGNKFQELNDERKAQGLIGQVKYSKFVAGAKVIDPEGLYIDTAGEEVTNRDFFCNLKAQAWWLVADRFRNTYNAINNGEKFDDDQLISISSEMSGLAGLVTELSTPRRDFDNTSRVKVESKKDLAKREIDSPNKADAFIMAYAPREQNLLAEQLKLLMGR